MTVLYLQSSRSGIYSWLVHEGKECHILNFRSNLLYIWLFIYLTEWCLCVSISMLLVSNSRAYTLKTGIPHKLSSPERLSWIQRCYVILCPPKNSKKDQCNQSIWWVDGSEIFLLFLFFIRRGFLLFFGNCKWILSAELTFFSVLFLRIKMNSSQVQSDVFSWSRTYDFSDMAFSR